MTNKNNILVACKKRLKFFELKNCNDNQNNIVI